MPVALVFAAGCGDGGPYAGTYKRELYGEGPVQMRLGSDGTVELNLPSPRWANNPTMTVKADFKGDTLIFPPDSAAAPCATAEARYVVNQAENGLEIKGIGTDACGGRRAALVGAWEKA